MKFSYDVLYSFYQVVRQGGVRKAAKILNMTGAGVSRQISQLEARLGLKLLKMNKGGIKVTNEGKIFFDTLKKCFPAFNVLESYFDHEEGELSGLITISTWHGIGLHGITKYIHHFLKEHKNLSIKINLDNLAHSFEDYYSDVVIGLKIEKRPDLIQKKVFDAEFAAYASEGYLSEYGVPKNFSDLDSHRLISASDGLEGTFHESEWHLIEGTNKTRKPYYVIPSSTAIAEAIKQDMGIGTLPTYFKAEEKGFIRLFPDFQPVKLEFFYIYPNYLDKVPKIVKLAEFLSNKLLKI